MAHVDPPTPKRSEREELTRVLAKLGGVYYADGLADEKESLAPYRAEADVILAAGFGLLDEPVFEYGWAPHAHSETKFPTAQEAREAYSMAVGHPIRRWKRAVISQRWVEVEEGTELQDLLDPAVRDELFRRAEEVAEETAERRKRFAAKTAAAKS